MRSLILNLLVAAIWLLLQPAPTLMDFFVGFALGFLLLVLFRPVINSHGYVRRMIAAWTFVGLFSRDFLISCGQLVHLSLFVPTSRLRSGFMQYDVAGLSRTEILLLSHCISLTPGTNTVDISPDFRCLHLHVLNYADEQAVRTSIDRNLRRGILAFTR